MRKLEEIRSLMNQQPSPHILPDKQSKDSTGSRLDRLNRLK